MNEEEKKEYIEHEILDRLYCLEEEDFDKNKVDDGYIKAVLNACKEAKNLIAKQSKEIEEYKKQLDLDYVDKHFVPIERYNQLEKEIEELKNEVMEKELIIDGLKEDRRIAAEEIQEEYYISKDKIKEKIEEYEEILQSSIIKEDYKKEVEHIIRVLEELKGE